MLQCIQYKKDGPVGIITMLQETMSAKFPGEMLEVLDQFEKDSSVRSVLLKNDGRFFCAGGDLSGGGGMDQFGVRDFISQSGKVASAIADLSKPVIALVNGAAAGGGANLALACDFVLASEKAIFREVFVNINFIPDTGGLWNLVHLIGPMRTKQLAMTGKIIGAKEAYELGMVTEVISSEQLNERGMEFARELAAKPPQAIRFTKEICGRIPEMTRQSYLEYEASIMALLSATEDHKEGVRAFLQKRAPQFIGK